MTSELDPPSQQAPARARRPTVPAGEKAIEAAIMSHVLACGPGASISPDEVAMAMGPDWRTKLTAVRRAAIRMAVAGEIDILRKGKPVDPVTAKGVIRLRVRAIHEAAS
jgi:hypothetical protein